MVFQPKILLVEDDADVREAMTVTLQRGGFLVSWAVNGQEALVGLRTGRKPRLIVLDLVMPVMDGWQFRFWQKKDPALAAIPVVVFSADADLQSNAHQQFGAAAYLQKPVDPDVLVGTVKRMIEADGPFAPESAWERSTMPPVFSAARNAAPKKEQP